MLTPAAPAALESVTPAVTAPFARARAALLALPSVPLRTESYTLTVTSVLPTINPAAFIVTFLITTFAP